MEDSNSELHRLRQEVAQLRQDKADLECLLETVITHSDTIEGQLYQLNTQLKSAIIDRQQAEAALQELLQTLLQEKADLEILLETCKYAKTSLEGVHYTDRRSRPLPGKTTGTGSGHFLSGWVNDRSQPSALLKHAHFRPRTSNACVVVLNRRMKWNEVSIHPTPNS